MNTTSLSPSQTEALIDTLDRAEQSQPNVWRKPLFDLQEHLNKAQRVRRWIATPLLGVSVAAPQLWREQSLATWLAASVLIGTLCLWLMQQLLERAYPVLAREARIESLRNYFSPWRDDETDEGLNRESA